MDMTSVGTDHLCKDLRRRVNKTTAGFVCLKCMMRSMVLTRGKKGPSSKMEKLGTRATRSTKSRKRTENLNTGTSRTMEEDRPRGKKMAMLGEGTVRILDTGACMDMENDDQPVLF